MSNAYSLLTAAAALLKVDKSQVKKGKLVASLNIQGIEITVSSTKRTNLTTKAKFSCNDSSCFRIKSEPFLSDYAEKLAGMIKSVVYKKMYSAPWVAVAVKELLSKKVGKCKVTLENDHVAILTLPPVSESKSDEKLQLSIVEPSGNRIGSYFYRVDYLDAPCIGSVIDVANLDQAIKDIANIAEGAYNKWIKENKVAPQPKTDHERDMADLYQFLKSRYRNMKDSSLTFTRTSSGSLSIFNIKNGDNCLISCDSTTGAIRVNDKRRYYRPSDSCFKRNDPKRFEKVASIVFGFDSESEE